MTDPMAENRARAEWVVFGISCLIVALVVGVVLVDWLAGPLRPPAFSLEQSAVERREGQWHLPVAVTNTGDETATQLQVRATVEHPDGSSDTADQVIDFIAGGEEVELTFVFGERPERDRVTVAVVAYQEP